MSLGTAADAAAQQDGEEQAAVDERARLHFESGAAYYDAGEYESALRDFERAYDLSQRPALFFNMYLCEQALGNLDAAADHLERFLNEVPDAPSRDTLQLRLAALRERVARRDAAEGSEPEPVAVEAQTVAPAEAPAAAPTARGDSTNVPAIIGFSVAGLGLIGAAIFGPLTLAEDDALASSPCGQAMTCTTDETSTLTTYALLTDVSLAVALAGAVAGTVLFFVLDDGGDAEQASLSVSPMAGPGTVGLVARGAL